jgi:hypothetical protein
MPAVRGRLARGRPAAAGSTRRSARAVVVTACAAAAALSGCYSYRRAPESAPVGAQVAVQINDRGRAALADSLGPSPDRVEGRLLAADDSTITLGVSAVKPRDGERTPWAGERVLLRRSSINDVLERRLSVARSVTVAAGVIGGVIAFFVTRDLIGDSDGGDSDRRPPGSGNDQ